MNAFNYEKDAEGIVTITMDMTGPVNSMNQEYRDSMKPTVERLQAEEGLTGVVFASAKKVFFAGGNLHELLATEKEDLPEFMAMLGAIKADFRALEKLPVPVVAAINGAALGGGLELCLACNHRIAWNDRSVQLGLPEVTLGLLPGGGGVVRMVNLLGLQKALPFLLEGTRMAPEQALAEGIIHETVDTVDELLPRARQWILDNRENAGAAAQPWDEKGYRIPGGNAASPGIAQLIMTAPAMLRKKTRGLLPAPERILDCAVEAVRVNFDTALVTESRGLANLVVTPEAKNQITTFFFGMNAVNGGASRPEGIAENKIGKVGVLGAGMMGQGIAYAAAMSGIEVVLKDISEEAAQKGKAYSEKLLSKRVDKGSMNEAKKATVLDLINATAENADLQGCDLIIEAVFENIDLKHQITRELEHSLAAGGVWGSNTSTLPITQLAEASSAPDRFIGIHFFSPVDKMPLVEIICGEKTSDETLAKAYDFCKQIRKTPIVVNDSLGFFTSRTFFTYLDEGARLLKEGAHPVLIDNMGKAVGMPVGPLALHDEVSLELTRKANETQRAMGVADKWGEQNDMHEIVNTMVNKFHRGGRGHGGGFYEYAEGGGKVIWPQLFELYYKEDTEISQQDMQDRLLFRQVSEALKCLESGVLRNVQDGNVGSILGIGAPAWTGGLIQFVNTYGLQRFIDRCDELAHQYGERFQPPAIVADKLAAGEQFE